MAACHCCPADARERAPPAEHRPAAALAAANQQMCSISCVVQAERSFVGRMKQDAHASGPRPDACDAALWLKPDRVHTRVSA